MSEDKEGKKVGRPKKTDGTKLRSFRLNDDEYSQVQAFIKDLKSKKKSSL